MAKKDKKILAFADWAGTRSSLEAGVLTQEMIENAARRAIENFGKVYPIQRFISIDGYKMLGKIQEIEPEWDNWHLEAEVWFKAKKLRLL